jgi:hypothetical protein
MGFVRKQLLERRVNFNDPTKDIYKDSKNSQSGKHVKEDQTHHSRMERPLPVDHGYHLA